MSQRPATLIRHGTFGVVEEMIIALREPGLYLPQNLFASIIDPVRVGCYTRRTDVRDAAHIQSVSAETGL